MKLGVLTVTFNRLQDLKKLLNIYDGDTAIDQLVIVNNNSNDGTKEFLDSTPELKDICHQCGRCMQSQGQIDIPYLFRIEGKYRHFGHLKQIAKEEYLSYTAKLRDKQLLENHEPIPCPWDIDVPARLRQLHKDIQD